MLPANNISIDKRVFSNLDSLETIGLMTDERGTSFLDNFLEYGSVLFFCRQWKAALLCEVERGPCRLTKKQRGILLVVVMRDNTSQESSHIVAGIRARPEGRRLEEWVCPAPELEWAPRK